jgi:hypothetical protein
VRIKRIVAPETAKAEIQAESSIIGKILKLDFDIPWTYLGYQNGVAAVRAQPGKSMLMRYLDDKLPALCEQPDVMKEIDGALSHCFKLRYRRKKFSAQETRRRAGRPASEVRTKPDEHGRAGGGGTGS